MDSCSSGPWSAPNRTLSASSGSMSRLTGSSYSGSDRISGTSSRLPGQALVAEPSVAHLAHEPGHSFCIAHLAGRVTEIELGQVAGEVLDADAVVGAVDGPLELGEVALKGVRALAGRSDVLVVGVVDRQVGKRTPGRSGGTRNPRRSTGCYQPYRPAPR